MNKKVIYVDFVFRKKRASSYKFHFLSLLNLKIKYFLYSFFKKEEVYESKIYPFKKIL